jgi:hypothetical protein
LCCVGRSGIHGPACGRRVRCATLRYGMKPLRGKEPLRGKAVPGLSLRRRRCIPKRRATPWGRRLQGSLTVRSQGPGQIVDRAALFSDRQKTRQRGQFVPQGSTSTKTEGTRIRARRKVRKAKVCRRRKDQAEVPGVFHLLVVEVLHLWGFASDRMSQEDQDQTRKEQGTYHDRDSCAEDRGSGRCALFLYLLLGARLGGGCHLGF